MTFDNDILTVQDALVTLIANFDDPNGGTVTASRSFAKTGIAGDQLPFVFVVRGRLLARNELASDLYEDTRLFEVRVFVTRLVDGEFNDQSEFDNAVNWIKPFHKYLAQNRHVSQAARIKVADVRDTGDVSLMTKNAIRYAGVVFTIPMIMITEF